MTNNCASPLVISHVLWDNNSTMSERVEYWLELCDEDLLTAKVLNRKRREMFSCFQDNFAGLVRPS